MNKIYFQRTLSFIPLICGIIIIACGVKRSPEPYITTTSSPFADEVAKRKAKTVTPINIASKKPTAAVTASPTPKNKYYYLPSVTPVK